MTCLYYHENQNMHFKAHNFETSTDIQPCMEFIAVFSTKVLRMLLYTQVIYTLRASRFHVQRRVVIRFEHGKDRKI